MTIVRSSTHVDVPKLARIPGGWFDMGKDGSSPDEAPRHSVHVRPFRAAVSPVTNALYSVFTDATGAPDAPFMDESRFANFGLPVVGINWHDAVAFCAWFREETGIPFRLPTEAEREYAALGGLPAGDWPWPGRNDHPVPDQNLAQPGPHVPAPECANGYGLRCMADNVHEWCSDWYARDYYAASPVSSPRGPAEGKRRASRGGSWRHRIPVTRITARSSLAPEFRYADFGFRVYADC